MWGCFVRGAYDFCIETTGLSVVILTPFSRAKAVQPLRRESEKKEETDVIRVDHNVPHEVENRTLQLSQSQHRLLPSTYAGPVGNGSLLCNLATISAKSLSPSGAITPCLTKKSIITHALFVLNSPILKSVFEYSRS